MECPQACVQNGPLVLKILLAEVWWEVRFRKVMGNAKGHATPWDTSFTPFAFKEASQQSLRMQV